MKVKISSEINPHATQPTLLLALGKNHLHNRDIGLDDIKIQYVALR